MSRVMKTYKSILYSVLGQIVFTLLSFLSRQIFVRVLSAEYLGVSGLFSSVISVLTLADLGIGSAIVYSLYKPLAENDIDRLKAIMNLFKKYYNRIAIVIFIIGVSILPFIGSFSGAETNIPFFEYIFLIYLLGAVSSYFFSYKRLFLIADQRKYIDSKYHYLFFSMRVCVQIISLLFFKSFIIFIVIQVVLAILEDVIVSRKIDELYPYLREEVTNSIDSYEKNEIKRNVSAIIYHKVGAILVMSTDNIIIAKYVGLTVVGIYSNYLLIITTLNTLLSQVFNSMIASIGNLGVNSEDTQKYVLFKMIDFVNYWLHASSSIMLFTLLNPFIRLWLGSDYIFSSHVVLVLTINFYVTGRRKSILAFREALGLFRQDKYKPIFESIFNLIFSIYLVNQLGIIGVFIGTFISTITTNFIVEPYVLYKHGFNVRPSHYYIKYTKELIVLAFIWMLVSFLSKFVMSGSIISFSILFLISFFIPCMLLWLVNKNKSEYLGVHQRICLVLKKRINI